MTDQSAPLIIGFGHLARTGKDAACRVLVEEFGYTRIGFTDSMNPFVYECFPEVAALVDELGWEAAKDQHPIVRATQQLVGNAARRHIGEDVWVDATLSKFEPGGRYAIANVRHRNEARLVQAAGGVVYRVDRPGVGPVNDHISEIDLLDFDGWDGVITNDGTLADLAEKVRSIVDADGVPLARHPRAA